MKGYYLIIAMILISGCAQQTDVCTLEAKICEDGSAVGRNPELSCEFNPCPDLQFCDALTPCPEGMECYKFQGEEPYCYSGDPCSKCPAECMILESYPAQIMCG